MNKCTDKTMFIMTAEAILKEGDASGMLIKENCVVIEGVVYERLASHETEDFAKYRFFFSDDDYDYLEDKEFEIRLDSLFNDLDKSLEVQHD